MKWKTMTFIKHWHIVYLMMILADLILIFSKLEVICNCWYFLFLKVSCYTLNVFHFIIPATFTSFGKNFKHFIGHKIIFILNKFGSCTDEFLIIDWFFNKLGMPIHNLKISTLKKIKFTENTKINFIFVFSVCLICYSFFI